MEGRIGVSWEHRSPLVHWYTPFLGRVHHEWLEDLGNKTPRWGAGFHYSWSSNFVMTAVPLWLPFLLTAAPTTWLWYRNRRTPAGHCKNCRYDLTGITTGICPECGTPINNEARGSYGQTNE
jgi:hypothetical protein